jgi:hypothetical protein
MELVSASSNRRETSAVLKTLIYWKDVLHGLAGQALTMKTDNMVTVFNLQRQGTSESLLYETRQIFSLLLRMDVRITVTHVPVVKNTTADALSRMDKVGDYAPKQEIFNQVTEFLNIRPTIDLFAADHNCKCKRYLAVSTLSGRNALGLDA